MTIHAFTELQRTPPAYINVSEREDETISVTVRSGGLGGAHAFIILPRRELQALADSLNDYLTK